MTALIDIPREGSRLVEPRFDIDSTNKGKDGEKLHKGYVATPYGYVQVASRQWPHGEQVTEMLFIHNGREHARFIGAFWTPSLLARQAAAFAKYIATKGVESGDR